MHRGFAKLYRKFLDWEWYDDIPTKVLFIHMLLKANHKEKTYRGTVVKRGTFLTSYGALADETGLTIKQVRLAVQKLIDTKYIGSERTRKGQSISIMKFDAYNDYDSDKGRERAGKGQGEGTARATTKNVKNVKNEKKYNPKHASLELDWLDNEIWAEWVDHKRKVKAAVTKRAMDKNIADLEKLGTHNATAIISQSLDCGWKGLFGLKDQTDTTTNNSPAYQDVTGQRGF
jgi:hypothetical protein